MRPKNTGSATYGLLAKSESRKCYSEKRERNRKKKWEEEWEEDLEEDYYKKREEQEEKKNKTRL